MRSSRRIWNLDGQETRRFSITCFARSVMANCLITSVTLLVCPPVRVSSSLSPLSSLSKLQTLSSIQLKRLRRYVWYHTIQHHTSMNILYIRNIHRSGETKFFRKLIGEKVGLDGRPRRTDNESSLRRGQN